MDSEGLKWRQIHFDDEDDNMYHPPYTQMEYEKEKEYVESNIWNKLEKVGRKISFAKDIFALFHYLKDPLVRWQRKAVIVAALMYFIFPVDTIPDFAPLVGYLDDLGVITATLRFLGSELLPYYD